MKKYLPIILLLFLAGCTTKSKDTFVSNPEDLNGSWRLVSILHDTVAPNTDFQVKKPYITLDYNNRKINGYSGCNGFGGEFKLNKDSISMPELEATQRGCLNNIEPTFFKQIGRTTHYWVTKDSLKFLSRDTILLAFKRIDDKKL